VTTWLIDKSALVRLAASPDANEWASRIERGLVRITTVTRLEIGYSARSLHDLRTGLQQPPSLTMLLKIARRSLHFPDINFYRYKQPLSLDAGYPVLE
jgi:predicted nucleic acid-binding protein